MSEPLTAAPSALPLPLRLKAAGRRLTRKLAPYNLAEHFNPVFDLSTGGEQRPVLYDIDATVPALRTLDAAYPVIRAELDAVRAHFPALPRYHEVDTDVVHSSGRGPRDRAWSVFMLRCFGRTPTAARELCPQTLALLEGIPGLYQAFFSLLDPRKSIPAHTGPSRAYLRYHLGLVVPRVSPPRIRIKDLTYVWKERESVLFDDSWNHEIINDCDELRAVLIVDVARPMPWPLRLLANAMQIGARLSYAPRVVGAMEARTRALTARR
jgi:aspartyl/asparaginyl beta-hydroxylase (cupin superfamily)